MQNQIIIIKNHIYQIDLDEGVRLNIRENVFDIQSLTIKEVRKFHWKCKTSIQMLAASSARETLTGAHIPVILVAVENASENTVCYILSLDTEHIFAVKRLLIKPEFLSFSHGNSPCGTMKLVDGPSVLVHGADGMVFYSSQDSCVLQSCFYRYKYIDMSPYRTCCNAANVETCDSIYFVHVYTILDRHFVFTSMNLSTDCPIHKCRLQKVLHICEIVNLKFCDIDTSKFIPVEYATTVSCLCVSMIGTSYVLSSSIYIGTSDGFVLHVNDGHVMNCISLSESKIDYFDGNSISSIDYGTQTDDLEIQNKLLICQENETEFKVLNKFKIESTYPDVHQVFVSEFINNGAKQFLLMKSNGFVNAQWILTDLFSVHLCSEDEAKQHDENAMIQSSGTVVKALQSRLQRETMCVEEQAKFYQERDSFVRDIWASCNPGEKKSKDETHSSQRAKLVALVTGCHDNRGLQRSDAHGDMPSVEVQEVWQRTFRGQWCIGADLVNKSDRAVHLFLTVVPCSATDLRYTRCRSKLTKSQLKTTDSTAVNSDFTDPKKQRLLGMVESTLTNSQPGTKTDLNICTVLCVLPMPDFSMLGQCSVFIMLDVSTPVPTPEHSASLESYEGNPSSKESSGSQQNWQVPCGQITLYSRDVVHGKHEVKLGISQKNDGNIDELKELHRDQLVWREVQTLTNTVVKSSTGIISDLNSLLRDKCRFVYCTRLDCFYTMLNGLQDVQLTLGPVHGQNRRDLDIFSMSDRDVLLLIHHLYNCLPDHILIIPRNIRSSQLKDNFLLSMGKEIHFLSDGINKLLNVNETQLVESEIDGKTDEESIRKVGEKFKHSRERLIEKQSATLNRGHVLEMGRQVVEMKRKTDLVVTMCEPR